MRSIKDKSILWKVLTALLLVGGIAIGSVGCSNLGYYTQAASGHLTIMAKREPIDAILQGEALSEKRRLQLEQAVKIRSYASKQLHLPDNGSYRNYVELERPFVVWNAVIAPKYSLTPEKWCFPVAGCVSYRGYYDQADAEAFAENYDDKAFDKYVGGSRAYSTLGWFNDPLTSPMLDSGEILLAEVIFHELAHQQLYIKNDTAFNEAFASAVGEQGVRQWLADEKPDATSRYERYLQRKGGFNTLLAGTAANLREIYNSGKPDEEKQRAKDAALEQLQRDYTALKTDWEGYTGYDSWFGKPVNNARLALVSVYRDLIPEFNRWLQACDNNLQQFYSSILPFAELDKKERLNKLKGPATCPAASSTAGNHKSGSVAG